MKNMSDETTLRMYLIEYDCFEYIEGNDYVSPMDYKVIVANSKPCDLPNGWRWSNDRTLPTHGMLRVRRIKHWNDANQQPVVLPCVSPMDDFDRVGVEEVGLIADNRTALSCLARYEAALQAEGRHDDGTMAGLTDAQIELAQRMWSAKLRRKIVETEKRERERVVCDDIDEMPNMVEA
jgi:hypothetical protein